jgi:hypothetical protein
MWNGSSLDLVEMSSLEVCQFCQCEQWSNWCEEWALWQSLVNVLSFCLFYHQWPCPLLCVSWFMNHYLLTLSTLSACSLYQAWTGRHGAQECKEIIIRIFAGNYSHSILKILATWIPVKRLGYVVASIYSRKIDHSDVHATVILESSDIGGMQGR